jgi:WD40 repeat protein
VRNWLMLHQFGHYQLLHSIGKGAFAEVFLGEHIYLKRQAAIKVLHSQSLAGNRNDFVGEARTAAQLDHPHIVHVWEFGVENGNIPYLIMEYANSGTLRKKYPPGVILSPSEILPHLRQITEALTYVHNKQLIHRDIKPANMLLDSQKGVLLSDFGISSLAHQVMAGTPAYMAPEQIQHNPQPVAASDQYALAVVIYEWLCGRCPFLPKSPQAATIQQAQEVWEQHLREQPPALRQFVPTLSPEIEQVILRALKKDPAERFASVEAFYQAFAQAITSVPEQQTAQASPSDPGQATAASPSGSSPNSFTVQANQQAAKTSLPGPGQIATIYPFSAIPATVPAGNAKQPGDVLYIRDNLEVRDGLPCGAIHALSWSPDGKRLAAGARLLTIFTWNAFTGDDVQTHRLHRDQIFSLAWSPDSRFLASGSADQLLHVWQPGNDQLLLSYKGHGGPRLDNSLSPACAVSWSPDGSRLASAGADKTIQVWRAADGALVLTCRGHTRSINAVCWSPDGSHLASASDDQTVRLWNGTTGALIETWQHHSGYVHALGWSPDGTHLASGGDDATIYAWEPFSRATLHNQLTYHGHTRAVLALVWSPDGNYLASGGSDQTVQIWDAASRQPCYTYRAHGSPILALAWSPDGHYIASSDKDGAVHVWRSI